jgi:hypothetical protein
MRNGQKRVRHEHPRSGIAHHFLDFLASAGGVAMDRASAAGRFVFLEGAMMQAVMGVGEERLAVIAEQFSGAVPIPAETSDHEGNGSGFSLETL